MGMNFYHYTNVTGLTGILTERKLRASEISFLSDISEYRTAMKMIRDLIESLISNTNNPEDQSVKSLTNIFLIIHESIVHGIFVTSFTAERGNNLNQWRSYCPIGGYSIGFNAEYIRDTFPVHKCIYNIDDQRMFFKETIHPYISDTFLPWLKENLSRFFKDKEGFILHKQPNFIEFYGRIRRIAPMFKHPKYIEENEWRVIIERKMNDNTIKFRPGRYFPIPYIEIEDIDLGQIEEIVIGPTPEGDISFMALRALHAKLGLDFKIVQDTIPYRSW